VNDNGGGGFVLYYIYYFETVEIWFRDNIIDNNDGEGIYIDYIYVEDDVIGSSVMIDIQRNVFANNPSESIYISSIDNFATVWFDVQRNTFDNTDSGLYISDGFYYVDDLDFTFSNNNANYIDDYFLYLYEVEGNSLTQSKGNIMIENNVGMDLYAGFEMDYFYDIDLSGGHNHPGQPADRRYGVWDLHRLARDDQHTRDHREEHDHRTSIFGHLYRWVRGPGCHRGHT